MTFYQNFKKHFLPYELKLLLLFLISLFFIFAFRSGGPISWDDLYYLDMAGRTVTKGAVINRYFHIFFLKPFIYFFHPITASRIYWALISVTSIGILYISSRLLFNHLFTAIMSVLIFFSMRVFLSDYSGVPYAEFTVTFFLMIQFLFYVFISKGLIKKTVFLFLTGLLTVLAIRSKEIGICLFFWSLLSFIHLDDDRITFDRTFLKNILFLMIGLIAGWTFTGFLDWYYLNDFLFFFRVENWRLLFEFNTDISRQVAFDRSNFFGQMFEPAYAVALPFLLFLLSFTNLHQQPLKNRICWFYFLIYPVFLLFCQIIGTYLFIFRYLLPTLPLLAILAGSYFTQFKMNSWKMFFLLGLIITLINVLIVTMVGTSWKGLERGMIFYFVILTISLFIVLISHLLNHNSPYRSMTLIIGSFIGLSYYWALVMNNYFSLNSYRFVEDRFLPLSQFEKEIKDYLSTNNTQKIVACSGNIYKQFGHLARNKQSCQWMFEIYFNLFDKSDSITYYYFDKLNINEVQKIGLTLLPVKEFTMLSRSIGSDITNIFYINRINHLVLLIKK